MAVDDLHEVTFVWPDLNANEVILTGTFDDWSRSIRLTKTPAGFQGTVKVPWGHRTLYKFIVDDHWMTAQSQPQETDNAGNVNSVYDSPPKPESFAAEESVPNKPGEDILESVSEPEACISKEYISPKNADLNGHVSERLVSAEMSESSPSFQNTSHASGPADLIVGVEEATDSQSKAQKVADGSTAAEPIIKESGLPKTDNPELVFDNPKTLAKVEGADVELQNDHSASSLNAQDSVEKSAHPIATVNLESVEVPVHVESNLVSEGNQSFQTTPTLAVGDPPNDEVVDGSVKGCSITPTLALVGSSSQSHVSETKILDVEFPPDHIADDKDLKPSTITDDSTPETEMRTELIQPSTSAGSQKFPAKETSEFAGFSSVPRQTDNNPDHLRRDGIDSESIAQPDMPGAFIEYDVVKPTVTKEESSSGKTQAVFEDHSAPSTNPISKDPTNGHLSASAPATLSKAENIRLSESKDTAGSSEFKSVRKKRLSLFGKVKQFFLHDKDDKGNQKQA